MRACNCEQAQELRKRIEFLEQAAINMQHDIAHERADHKLLQAWHEELQRRYDILMQRNKE